MKWSHTKEDGDNYIRDEKGEAIMCDTSYYPWISMSEKQWKMVAAAPELLELLTQADKIIIWEAKGLGNDFSDRVEELINALKP